MNNLIEVMGISYDDNPHNWWCEWNNSTYSPVINQGDVVFIEKNITGLNDGDTFLFQKIKEGGKQIIRKVSYTLIGGLRLSTPTSSEEVDVHSFLEIYEPIARIVKSISIIEKKF